MPRSSACWSLQYFYTTAQKVAAIPYSQFQQLLHDGKVAELGVSDRYIQGKLKEPLARRQSQFVTTRVDPQFADELQKYGVTYSGEVESTLVERSAFLDLAGRAVLRPLDVLARRMARAWAAG